MHRLPHIIKSAISFRLSLTNTIEKESDGVLFLISALVSVFVIICSFKAFVNVIHDDLNHYFKSKKDQALYDEYVYGSE